MKVKKKMEQKQKADLVRLLAQKALSDASMGAQDGTYVTERSDAILTTSKDERDMMQSARIEQATLDLKSKNQLLEAMERDLRERVEQNSIRYNPPKLIEKPETPKPLAPV